jgi:hypothetical protein
VLRVLRRPVVADGDRGRRKDRRGDLRLRDEERVGDYRPPPPVAPVSSRIDRTRWVWRGLLFVVGFAGGWWVVNQLFFNGFPFPDQVAGQPRVESREAEEATEALSALGGLLDVEGARSLFSAGPMSRDRAASGRWRE